MQFGFLSISMPRAEAKDPKMRFGFPGSMIKGPKMRIEFLRIRSRRLALPLIRQSKGNGYECPRPLHECNRQRLGPVPDLHTEMIQLEHTTNSAIPPTNS